MWREESHDNALCHHLKILLTQFSLFISFQIRKISQSSIRLMERKSVTVLAFLWSKSTYICLSSKLSCFQFLKFEESLHNVTPFVLLQWYWHKMRRLEHQIIFISALKLWIPTEKCVCELKGSRIKSELFQFFPDLKERVKKKKEERNSHFLQFHFVLISGTLS